MDLISLAVKCRLISPDKEAALIGLFTKKQAENPDYTVAELFRETHTLSHEDVEFLLAVKDHLRMKMLDKRFGELGIANRLIRPESVREALDQQSAIFKKTKQSKLIGDILIEKNEITQAHKTAILLTQDRIEDEYLAEAMNDIATSEIERISVNMRFGAIAVKKGIVTIDQLNTALKVQEEEVEAGRPRRYLGEILQELFGLSEADLKHILRLQKEFEKKRLSLETAISRYYSETNTNKRLSRLFAYHFSKNKLAAHVRRIQDAAEPVDTDEFMIWLRSIGITSGILAEKKLASFLASGTKGEQVCIAEGTPPQPGKNEAIEFFFDTAPKAPDAPEDSLALVRKGDVLARITPPEEGRPGTDVCGFTISPPPPKRIPINGGQGVAQKNGIFVADTDGVATLYKNRTLFVQPRAKVIPKRHHAGHLNTDRSEEYQESHLTVEGTIQASGRVRCQTLEVTEDVFGQVFSSGEIHVKGDIGQADPKEAPAKLRAEGDIFANKKIIHAVLITAKGLKAPNADLISTEVTAFQDIVVKNILSNGGTPCVLRIGKHADDMETPFDEAIQTHKTALASLLQHDELNALEKRFKSKLGAKDEYLAQHQALTYLLALTDYRKLDKVSSLRAKLAAAQKRTQAYPDLPPLPREALDACTGFLAGLFEEVADYTPEDLVSHIREMKQIKYGMYRAAVSASRRHHSEYQAQKKAILKKTDACEPEIRKIEAKIRTLVSQRDGFLLRHEIQPLATAPTIKVKNQVEKGTIIQGQQSVLTVDQNIYGVKFTETRKNPNEDAFILIEGLYE